MFLRFSSQIAAGGAIPKLTKFPKLRKFDTV